MGKKVSLTELPIHTYRPTDPQRMCVAMIGSLPMIFKAPTVEAVRAKADAWRHEEVAKLKAAEAKRAERAASPKQSKDAVNA